MTLAEQLGLSESDQFCIYLRKSRADAEAEKLGEGETLARHERILTEFATREGLPIGKIYREIVSGETIAARKEIQSMISDCYAGIWRGVIVVEVTRLSRGNQGDAQTIMDCLRYGNNNKGMLVVTPTKVYDIVHSQDDEEYMEFELFMSRREYKMIRKRMERGKYQSIIEGNYLAPYRPLGYNIVKTKTGRTLSPNPDEVQIVKNIFHWYLDDHLSYEQIRIKLFALGIASRSGGEWSASTIKHILSNPVYIGKVRWNNRVRVKNMVNGQLVTSLPRKRSDRYMLYEGKHEAIIDEETFKAVNERFSVHRTKADLKLINPLAGLLICKKCKKAIRYQAYWERPTTAPRFVHKSSQLCKVKSAMADDVINAVIHSLELYIDDFQMKIDNTPKEDEDNILSQIEHLEKELQKQEKKLPKLFDAWEDGLLNDNEFAKRKLVNRQRIQSIQEQIVKLNDSMPSKEDYKEKIVSLSDALNALQDSTLTADVKNNYLKNVIEVIEFSRENSSEFILDVRLKD